MVGRFPALKYLLAASSNCFQTSSGACRHETSAWTWISIATNSSTFIIFSARAEAPRTGFDRVDYGRIVGTLRPARSKALLQLHRYHPVDRVGNVRIEASTAVRADRNADIRRDLVGEIEHIERELQILRRRIGESDTHVVHQVEVDSRVGVDRLCGGGLAIRIGIHEVDEDP